MRELVGTSPGVPLLWVARAGGTRYAASITAIHEGAIEAGAGRRIQAAADVFRSALHRDVITDHVDAVEASWLRRRAELVTACAALDTPVPGSVRVQQLPVRNRLARRCPPVFLSRPETRAFPPRIVPQSPRAGSRRTRPFHARGSAAHFGSAGWLAPCPRRPANRTPVRSLRHGSSGPLPPSPGP